MKRRDFLKNSFGVITGVVVAPVIIKAKTKPSAEKFPIPAEWKPKYSEELSKETYHWINRGCYRGIEWIKEWQCCYTRKDGRKMCRVLLFDDIDDVEEIKKITEKRMHAIKGGAWYPTDKTVYNLL